MGFFVKHGHIGKEDDKPKDEKKEEKPKDDKSKSKEKK